MFQLNYAPPPYQNESLRGYLERLNLLNGFKGAQYICSMVPFIYIPNSRPGSKYYNKEINLISPVVRQPEDTLIKIFNNHWLTEYFKLNPHNTVHYHSKNFRYCPECLRQNPCMLTDWDFPLVTECSLHNLPLCERCPYCNQLLQWKSKRLFTCDNCGRSIIENHASDKSDPILCQLSSDISCGSGFDYISTLILAVRRAFRPRDNELSMPPLETMELDEIRQLLFEALGLLHSEIYRRQYFLYLKHIKDTYKEVSIDACMEAWLIFSDECFLFLDNKYPELIFENKLENNGLRGVTPKRLNSKRKPNCESISHQISGQRLCKLFKIRLSSLEKIIDHGLIKPDIFLQNIGRTYFNLNSICKQLNKLEIHTGILPIDEIPLLEVEQYLPMFNLHFGHLIEYLFNQQIHLYCEGKHKQLIHCKVSKSNVLNIFHSIISKQIIPFDSKTIAKLLCTNESLLIHLESDELVFSNHWSRDFELHTDQFCALMEHYICLNRVAFFSSIDLYHLEELLIRNGITIPFSYSHYNYTLKLIAATSDNYAAIQKIIQPYSEQYLGYLPNNTDNF